MNKGNDFISPIFCKSKSEMIALSAKLLSPSGTVVSQSVDNFLSWT